MVKETELNDKDLREELSKYGVAVGPILPTTRGVYVKKLQKLKTENKCPGYQKSTNGNHSDSSTKSNRKLKQTKIARKTFGFSSDESDNEEKLNKGRSYITRKTRRSSPVNQTPPVNQTSSKETKKPIHRKVEGLAEPRRSRRSVTPVSQASVANGYSDDSDEEKWEEVTSVDISTSPYLHHSPRSSLTPRRPLMPQRSIMTSSRLSHSSKIETPLSAVTRNGGKSLRKRKFDSTKDDDNDESASHEYDDSADEVVASAENFEPKNSERNFFSSFKSLFSSRKPGQFANSEVGLQNSWRLHCSVLLPIGTVVFFIILGLLYITMRSDSLVHSERLIDISETLKIDSPKPMAIVNSMYDILSKAAGDKICNYTEASDVLSFNKLKKTVQANEGDFMEALKLIKLNPQWEFVMWKDRKQLLGKDDNVKDVRYLSSLRPFIPTLCRFWRAVEKVLFRVTMVVLAMIIIWLSIIYQQYRARKLNEEKQLMFDLVEKILDVLKKHYETSCTDGDIQPFLPILHARDMII
uniref:LEM domain-containing protein n=3 Tax=Ciona intestinalis TaxID=7719 RepID=H2XU03_CIOIN